jgi:hypothetical protein
MGDQDREQGWKMDSEVASALLSDLAHVERPLRQRVIPDVLTVVVKTVSDAKRYLSPASTKGWADASLWVAWRAFNIDGCLETYGNVTIEAGTYLL